MCCDNPIDLGCKNKCEGIIIPLACTLDYTIKASFNGVNLPIEFSLGASNYPHLDMSDLNEDYTFQIGVFNQLGINVGCYKVKLSGSGSCCEVALSDGFKVLSDYANFNSDDFLANHVGSGYQYGYECEWSKYNDLQLGSSGGITWFDSTDIQRVPIQVAPRDTISAHNTDNPLTLFLSYDKNWIDFLNTLKIATKVDFRTSPFTDGVTVDVVVNGITELNQHRDANYPSVNLGNANPVDTYGSTYGEGFQIEYNKGNTFAFKINFYYRNGVDVDSQILGHSIIYRDSSYEVDGAILYPHNTRTIQIV
jgi:hypothetical protein